MVNKILMINGVPRLAPQGAGAALFVSAQLPSINGVFESGQTVTADPGLWNDVPDSVLFQWFRNGVAISGATDSSYSLTVDDIGTLSISVRATPVKSGWTGGAHTSDPVTIADPEPPLPDPDAGLFFKKSEATSTRKVYCHWFRYPLEFANVAPGGSSTYENNYLTIAAEPAIGAILRDRPITQGLKYTDGAGDHNMPFGGSPAWGVQAQMADIEEAIAIGIDGWFHDVLGGSGQNWDILLNNLAAASYYPGFEVIPMLDCNGSLGQSSVATIVERLRILLAYDAVPVVGGKKVLCSYRTENVAGAGGNHTTAAANWTAIKNQLLSTYGFDVTFWHCFGTPPSSQATLAQYTNVTAVGRWGYGGADPGIINAASMSWADYAKNLGYKVFPPIFSYWARARYGEFDESRNTRALQAAWDKAASYCGPNDMVQICTWNDYSEGHQIAPTAARGYSTWAMTAWNIQKFKHGVAPRISRDALVVTHRNQLSNCTITGGQTTFMVQRSNANRSSFREHVEVVSFLTKADTITLTTGSNTYTYTAPAGEYVYSAPLAAGSITVSTGRGVSVEAPVTVRTTSANQDRNYKGTYSLRTSAQQGDPTPAS